MKDQTRKELTRLSCQYGISITVLESMLDSVSWTMPDNKAVHIMELMILYHKFPDRLTPAQLAEAKEILKYQKKREEIALCEFTQSYEPKEAPKAEPKIDVKKEG